jgi:hypothetical protein
MPREGHATRLGCGRNGKTTMARMAALATTSAVS